MLEFESYLANALSPLRELRQNAEKNIENKIKLQPTETFLALISFLSNTVENLASLSSILLLNKYFEGNRYGLVDQKTFDTTFDLLTEKLNKPVSKMIRKNIAKILIRFSEVKTSQDQFFNYIAECFQSNLQVVQCFACYLLESASESEVFVRIIRQQAEFVNGILFRAVASCETEVRFNAVLSFFRVFEKIDEERQAGFSACFVKTLEVIVDEPDLRLIDGLLEVTKFNVAIWNGKLDQLIILVLTIVKREEVLRNTKELVVEILKIVIESLDKSTQSNKFWQDTVTIAFTLLADVDYPQDIELWAASLSDPSESDLEHQGFTLLREINEIPQCSDLICQMTQAHLNCSHWVYQSAGIRASALLPVPTPMQILSFSNSNLRVQYSLMKYIEELILLEKSHDLCPHFLRFVLSQCSFQYPSAETRHKMTAFALQVMSEIFSFLISRSNETNRQILSMLPEVYSVLFSFLSNTSTLYQSIEALTSIINYSGASFEAVSNKFLPGLLSILTSPAPTHEDQEIRASCIRCLGSIAESCEEILDFSDLFIKIWSVKSSIPEDEKGVSSIWEILPEFHKKLKSRFSVFLQPVLTDLLSRMSLDLDVHHRLNEIDQAGYTSFKFYVEGKGVYYVVMNEANLQAKTEAVHTLYQMIDYHPDTLETYSKQITQAVFSLMSQDVTMTFKELKQNLLSVLELLPHLDSSDEVLMQFFPILLKELQRQKDPTSLLALLKSTHYFLLNFKSVSAVGLTLAHAYSQFLARSLHRFLTESGGRDQAKAMKYISESVCLLLKSFRQVFSPIFMTEFQLLFSNILWNPSLPAALTLGALNIYCDFVSFTGNLLLQTSSCPLLMKFIELCYHSEPDIRNSAASAIGKCIEKDGKTVACYLNELVPALCHIVSLPDARGSLVAGSESAAACIGKIAVLFKPELFALFIDWVPFTDNAKEAKEMHELLLMNLSLVPGASQPSVLSKLRSTQMLNDASRSLLMKLGN